MLNRLDILNSSSAYDIFNLYWDMIEPKHQEASLSALQRIDKGLLAIIEYESKSEVSAGRVAAKVTPVRLFQKLALASGGVRYPQVTLQDTLHGRNYTTCIFHLVSYSRKQKSKVK